MELVFPKKQY